MGSRCRIDVNSLEDAIMIMPLYDSRNRCTNHGPERPNGLHKTIPSGFQGNIKAIRAKKAIWAK